MTSVMFTYAQCTYNDKMINLFIIFSGLNLIATTEIAQMTISTTKSIPTPGAFNATQYYHQIITDQ